MTPLFGGPVDKPIIWRMGGNYHILHREVYWKKVFEENGCNFAYNSAPGGYANIDFVLARFKAKEKYRYATRTHAHLEFTRKTQAFLTPKGLYMGYVAELYDVHGSAELGTITTRIVTPGGISIGVFSGILPAYPYFSLNVGASLVSEQWDLKDSISGAPKFGDTKSTGFWGMVRAGLFYQIRSYFAADLSFTYGELTLRHTKEELVPTTIDPATGEKRDAEAVGEFKIGLGLIFAMPWKVEKTIW